MYPTEAMPRVGEPGAVPASMYRPNIIRDVAAGVLLLLGLLLPWNVYTGITIGGTAGWVIGLLVIVTLLPLIAVLLTHKGPNGFRNPAAGVDGLNRLRLTLAAPYLAVVAGFIVFAVVQVVRVGGTNIVPPGVGPGLWLGLAGALLVAQPVLVDSADVPPSARIGRIIALVSVLFAVAAVLFNLYWRTRFVIPLIGKPEVGTQNLVVAVVAVLYGLVALVPVVIAARFIMSPDRVSRISTVLLGGSTLVAGLLLWVLPVGRQLDAFHGIAQDTSAAGVGYEGYLAWVAAAAIGGSVTVLAAWRADAAAAWSAAARKCLILIAAWCAGSAVLRIADIMLASVLDKPDPPSISVTLMVFDLVVALVAAGVFVNAKGSVGPRLLLPALYAFVFALTVVRIVLGVVLIPRVPPLNQQVITSVYGNTLTQQITGIFDMVLCVLGLALVAIAVVAAAPARRPVPVAAPIEDVVEPSVAVVVEVDDAVVSGGRHAVGSETIGIAVPGIARIDPPAEPEPAPEPAAAPAPKTEAERIAEVLAESSRRFGAGTTYGGPPSTP